MRAVKSLGSVETKYVAESNKGKKVNVTLSIP